VSTADERERVLLVLSGKRIPRLGQRGTFSSRSLWTVSLRVVRVSENGKTLWAQLYGPRRRGAAALHYDRGVDYQFRRSRHGSGWVPVGRDRAKGLLVLVEGT
jgi:hypothetical protein